MQLLFSKIQTLSRQLTNYYTLKKLKRREVRIFYICMYVCGSVCVYSHKAMEFTYIYEFHSLMTLKKEEGGTEKCFSNLDCQRAFKTAEILLSRTYLRSNNMGTVFQFSISHICMTLLSKQGTFTHYFILEKSHNLVIFIVSNLQLEKLRRRELKWLSQYHTTVKTLLEHLSCTSLHTIEIKI